MPSDVKALEKKLDRDFLRYLSLTKKLFNKIVSEDEKTLCEAWLKKLCGKCITTISGRRDRNIYLSRLILQMQDGKLKDIFLSAPPIENLQSPYTVFGLPKEVEDLKGFEEMGFQLDTDITGGSGDFTEASRDGRTYLATREIKNGMMAYLAVTITEDEPLWLPQQVRQGKMDIPGVELEVKPSGGRFIKRLAQFECIPLVELRRSAEERQRILEWMDKIIEGCNKWLRGENPHNEDLNTLFELLYQDYEEDEEKAELLQFPRDVRDVIMREIREIIKERRAEVSRRELILDQYEADEYEEEKFPPFELDTVWQQCARKPMAESVKRSFDKLYPLEVIQRFFELLVQERILIIEKGERDANRRIAEMRTSNLEDVKKELQRVEKLKREYKEYYCIYKEAEEWSNEYKNELRESGAGNADKGQDKKQDMMNLKSELENEIEGYRLRYMDERKNQGKLVEKLEEAKESYCALRDRLKCDEERLKNQKDTLLGEKQKLKELIDTQRKRLCDLKNQVKFKQMNNSGPICDNR